MDFNYPHVDGFFLPYMDRGVYGAYQNDLPPLWDIVRFALGLVKLTTHKSGNRTPEAHI